MTRDKAYKWLSKEIGLPKEQTHIGMFEKEQCEKVMEISQKKLQESGVAIWN